MAYEDEPDENYPDDDVADDDPDDDDNPDDDADEGYYDEAQDGGDPDRGEGRAAGVARHILEQLLDRGLVIAGEVTINLPDTGPLTLKPRLVIAPADTARQIGIDWWEHDPSLTSPVQPPEPERDRLASETPKPERREPEGRGGRRSLDPATEFVGDHPIYREGGRR